MQDSSSFWQSQFSYPAELVALPLDHSRPPVPSYLREEMCLAVECPAEALNSFAQLHETAPIAVLVSAVHTVLHRLCGQERILTGVARSGHPLLPIQTEWDADASRSSEKLLREISQRLSAAESHGPFSLAELQATAGAYDPAYGKRLFNIAICMADSSSDSDWPMFDPSLAEFLMSCDMVITVSSDGAGLELRTDYDSSVLTGATVERWMGYVGAILRGVIATPAEDSLSLPMLTAAEQAELLAVHQRDKIYDPGKPLHRIFEEQAARRPNAIAATCDGKSLTYAELNACANRVAHALRERGVAPNSLVGLCMDRGLELLIGLLGIVKSGGAYLPIDPVYPKDRAEFMLRDAEVRIAITQTKLIDHFPAAGVEILLLDDTNSPDFQGRPSDNLSAGSTIDDLAYAIYTSGTTGKSKGSLITHRNVTRLFLATEPWYNFDERDVWTLFHSSAFDFSVWEIWGALLYGGRLVVVPFMVTRSPEAFYELLISEKVTVLNQTPSAFRQLIQAMGPQTHALRYVIFGGEALEMQSLRPWFERHGDQMPRLVNMYGITETTVHVTYRLLSKNDLESASVIGVPIPDLTIFILDSRRQLAPRGVAGEIYVGGAGLARGYLNRPELTAQRFLPDHLTHEPGARLYRTGDLGRLLPNGDVEYLGRADHQVKIRGFRIELGEIESVLCAHAGVREALVMAREDMPGQKRLVAYLVASPARPDLGELRNHLKKKIPDYMVPAAFVFLEKLPLTANGKVDRKALPSPDAHTEPSTHYVAPRTPSETSLATIWANVLRLPRVSVTDNFFELGGDSILGLQVISLARKAGIQLTPTLLFSKPTIAELAGVPTSDGEANRKSTSADEDQHESGDVPLTPIQHWFFEQELTDPHHYNQAFCFELRERLDRKAFAKAVEAVECCHGALGFRYAKESGGRRPFYGAKAGSALRWIDLSGLGPEQQQEAFERETSQAQAQFDLEKGPLWTILGFDYADRPGRLAIAIHHLAIDGVSWRILLEDLETAYEQARAGKTPTLSRTSSFKRWADRLQNAASSGAIQQELSHWLSVADRARNSNFESRGDSVEDTEALAQTSRVSLSPEETSALLKEVPAVYNTRINDVLLTALTLAWSRWADSRRLFVNLEGHGREPLFEDVDVTRTMGWFTSVYPVLLELPQSDGHVMLEASLKGIKEQLRQIPNNGIGYGLLRYLRREAPLGASVEPEVVFNYFGQFDQVVANSKLFRFSSESMGPWHAAKQHRRHALEVNCMVIEGRLEMVCTYGGKFSSRSVPELAKSFAVSLREVIAHCLAPDAGGRTPSDFPLARLNQSAVDELIGDGRQVEDIYPLSPLQKLFLSADPGALRSAFDHWHGTLEGSLDVEAFQRAWQEAVKRHPVLRTAVRGAQAVEPMQIVYRDVRPQWIIEDWRGSVEAAEKRWEHFLNEDRKRPLALAYPPALRFSLVRISEQRWKFLWSTPSLLLDGWSWPLVFEDVSRIYGAISQGALPVLEPVRPYRDYIEWLGKQRSEEAEQFWRRNLAGFRNPTVLMSNDLETAPVQDAYFEKSHAFSEATTSSLLSTARQLQLTLNTVVQAAWAILVSHHSGQGDVVFGSAFSGRPTDLPGSETIVGPFVNNLPVRISVEREIAASDLLRDVHKRCVELLPFQFLPLVQIQGCSELPWRSRLFDSIVVFQNYQVGDAAKALGNDVKISNFHGPIHTNYPVLLLVEPGLELRLTMICNGKLISEASATRWLNDTVLLLEQMTATPQLPIEQLMAALSPREVSARPASRRLLTTFRAPPQTATEFAVAGVWNRMFGEEVGVEDNFFEIGGHSLLLVRMYGALQDEFKKEFPITSLFEHPTVRSLSRFLDGGMSPGQTRSAVQSRADRSRAAFTRARTNIATR